ncbi:MAG: phosphatase PAP2 family protein [Proteobacteria bacterium]|nr:phosphatase PAP2 family protein [Pseudomonadota bacterium]
MFCNSPAETALPPESACIRYAPGRWDQDLYTIPLGGLLVAAVSRIDPPKSPRWPFGGESATEKRRPTRHPSFFAGALAGASFVPLAGSILSDNPSFPLVTHIRGLVHSHLWTELLTSGAKVYFGRKRPFFDTAERTGKAGRDDRLSFFSGHSSHSFAFATYASQLGFHEIKSRPVSWLYASVLYSTAAWIASSRAVDRQHNWSDVLVGSAAGAGIGYLVFNRVNSVSKGDLAVTVLPDRLTVYLKIEPDR